MPLIKSFEDLLIWKRGRSLSTAVYRASSRDLFVRDFALRDQLRRAVLSVPLNIAEGFGRRSKREFRRFLLIAHGSLAEVQTCLYIALDLQYLEQDEFTLLYKESEELSRMISSLVGRLGSA
ncbi:MAG: four helix bundle protein [Candidatus Kapaibacterium sp.]